MDFLLVEEMFWEVAIWVVTSAVKNISWYFRPNQHTVGNWNSVANLFKQIITIPGSDSRIWLLVKTRCMQKCFPFSMFKFVDTLHNLFDLLILFAGFSVCLLHLLGSLCKKQIFWRYVSQCRIPSNQLCSSKNENLFMQILSHTENGCGFYTNDLLICCW